MSTDENNDLKSQLSELNRRFHELEIEYRRLENEREELAAAYKESEAVWLDCYKSKERGRIDEIILCVIFVGS